jgi:hypothetical protein
VKLKPKQRLTAGAQRQAIEQAAWERISAEAKRKGENYECDDKYQQ